MGLLTPQHHSSRAQHCELAWSELCALLDLVSALLCLMSVTGGQLLSQMERRNFSKEESFSKFADETEGWDALQETRTNLRSGPMRTL